MQIKKLDTDNFESSHKEITVGVLSLQCQLSQSHLQKRKIMVC